MDKIFIIEEHIYGNKEYKPNFTIPSSSNHIDRIEKPSSINSSTIASTIGGVLAAASFVSLPTSLLINAAIASPSIYKAITSKKSQDAPLNEVEAREIEHFLIKNGMTIRETRERGFKFPPGHPIVDQSYRLHPLANFSNTKKADTYMSESDYDNILLEEREAELLKILINLGATKIEIIEKDESDYISSTGANLEVDAGIGSAGVNGTTKSNKTNKIANTRIYNLVGKRWIDNDTLNRNDYAWLSYEPQWDTLITAREIGGCTTATVEIKQLSKYSADKEISASVKAKVYEMKGDMNNSKEHETNKSYIINVCFSIPLESKNITKT